MWSHCNAGGTFGAESKAQVYALFLQQNETATDKISK